MVVVLVEEAIENKEDWLERDETELRKSGIISSLFLCVLVDFGVPQGSILGTLLFSYKDQDIDNMLRGNSN